MQIDELYETIKNLKNPSDNSFNVVNIDNSYYGKTKEGYIVFVSEINYDFVRTLSQKTKNLFLSTNMKCILETNENFQKGTYNVLICFEPTYESIILFLQLTNVYSKALKHSSINIYLFFETLKNLFSNNHQLSLSELQGLFGELYFIDYIHEQNLDTSFDISDYWQSKEKMKFDFSITDRNKIEVKTTIKSKRIHKFRHEQLVSDIYNIWIVSIMLQEDDQGLSLYKLSEKVKKNHPTNLNMHIQITNLLNNYSKDELEKIKFNENYIKNNIAFYKTNKILKFNEKQPSGVYNTEYDSDLTNVEKSSKNELIEWIFQSLK